MPALYIVPEKPGKGAAEAVREALVNVYIKEGALETDILPTQLILVDDIPCNANGKIDIYRITRDRLKGEAWNIAPVRKDGRLTDVLVEPAGQADSITGGTLPEGMEGRSALGIYELFNAPPEEKRKGGLPGPTELCRSMRAERRKILEKMLFGSKGSR